MVVSVVLLAALFAALIWMLSTAYPTLWCSIFGSCNA